MAHSHRPGPWRGRGAADDETPIAALKTSEAASENALLLIRLHSLLTGIIGDDAKVAASWLKSYHVALDARPLELMEVH